jgi:uncharacterized protein (TIGR04552 family)
MTDPAKQRSTRSGAFLPRRDDLVRSPGLRGLGLQDVHEIRLLLGGDSVIDWHRLALRDASDVRRLLAVNSIDVDNPEDLDRLDALRTEAVRYIRDVLNLRLDEELATRVPALELPLLASGRGRFQRQACTLLKVMHIIYHLDARELRMALPISDNELFEAVEHSVVTMFDELRSAGVPVVEFSWSRKSKDSLVTKLLVKRETSAARVFDRLRFRVVVTNGDDILPTLHVMLRRFIPFNYVVPGQTVNNLVDMRALRRRIGRVRDVVAVPRQAPQAIANEFSSRGYQVLNFIADLPVRVDGLLHEDRGGAAGNVVFVLAEFQIIDRERAQRNEQGESSHVEYKRRQHQRVRERLLREPKKDEDERDPT